MTTINPLYQVDEIRHQLHDSHATAIFTLGAFVEKINAAKAGTRLAEIITFDNAPGTTAFSSLLADKSVRLTAQVPVNTTEKVVVIPYSSGTTGLAKGVL